MRTRNEEGGHISCTCDHKSRHGISRTPAKPAEEDHAVTLWRRKKIFYDAA